MWQCTIYPFSMWVTIHFNYLSNSVPKPRLQWACSAWHPACDLQMHLNLPHACSAPLHKTLYIPTLFPGVIYYLYHLYCKHTRRALEFSLEYSSLFMFPMPKSILTFLLPLVPLLYWLHSLFYAGSAPPPCRWRFVYPRNAAEKAAVMTVRNSRRNQAIAVFLPLNIWKGLARSEELKPRKLYGITSMETSWDCSCSCANW